MSLFEVLNHVSVSAHALERFQEHYPTAEKADVRVNIEYGEEVSVAMAMTLTGRQPPRKKEREDRYVIIPSRRGMAVLVADLFVEGQWHVVTYIRFLGRQLEFAKENWPTLVAPKRVVRPVRSPQQLPMAMRVRQELPMIGVALSYVGVSPDLISKFGTRNRARVNLLTAKFRAAGKDGSWVAATLADGTAIMFRETKNMAKSAVFWQVGREEEVWRLKVPEGEE